ncbi:DUF4179 domain-containing protein [Lysinibacillus sp. FSL K6-0232]|uniref:DUF4179 domain-containing protein n=1 Tax=unclassified Lysinibacillus TaxID=2636778 RepID=UPI0030FBF8B0
MLADDMLRVIDLDKENRGRKKWVMAAFLLLIVASGAVLYLWWDKEVAFEAYKTEVEKTSKNSLGCLTLHEVIIDDNQILLNATFEPGKTFAPGHQLFFFPQILINGKDYMVRSGGQSIAQSTKAYTIYNSIKMDNLPKGDSLQLDIRYKDWNVETPIEEPWEFQVEASQEQLQEDRHVFTVEKKVKHVDQQEVKIDRIVSTPISTTIYFYTEQRLVNDAIPFKIQSKGGKTWHFKQPYSLNHEGTKWGSRVDALYLTEKNYKLFPVDMEGNKLGPALTIKKDD